ncbi:hypothetical protein Sjap_020189 [Stephania japonica]|uniref:DNA-directed RNA polymerase III subunit RPC4 n=1 Tax=Stephania japonica TaxID=461633 RepID=A0AAP0F2X8_9MAGN
MKEKILLLGGVRFQPKARPRKTTKAAETKIEVHANEEEAQKLLHRINEARYRGPKAERKSTPAQVVFGYTSESNSIRTYGGDSSRSCTSILQGPMNDEGSHTLVEKKQKEYTEPWNYYSNYPVTLPLRQPYSGNPEVLDEEEFGEKSANLDYNEKSINPAAELGLMNESENERMLFIQLPASLPSIKRSATAKGKDAADNSNPGRNKHLREKGCILEELKPGFMGKMLVYKSGAVKMKLGKIIYDMSPGSDCIFPQDVAAINTKEKQCCIMGGLNKRAVVTPDMNDSFFDVTAV